MVDELDLYKVLGVSPEADTNTIKQAYRQQMRRYHPDAFAGAMAQAKEAGDLAQMRQLERQMEESKTKTKQLNIAYELLSDPDKRYRYNLKLKDKQHPKTSKPISEYPEDIYADRTTPKSRPHHKNNPTKNNDNTFPIALFGAFIGGLLLIFTLMTGFSGVLPALSSERTEGQVSAQDLQNTQSAYTRIEATLESQLGLNPRRCQGRDCVDAGRYYLEQGHQNTLAVSYFNSAIEQDFITAEVYFLRGKAHDNLARLNIDPNYFNLAMSDYSTALSIDDTYLPAYLSRAELLFRSYQESPDNTVAAQIREDLTFYQANTDDNANRIQTILNQIP
jgi:curved DNA-binding protein CbpA